MTFADPTRLIEDARAVVADANRLRYAVVYPGPADEPDEPDLWHLHVAGVDIAPCGRSYHQPRRAPSTVPVVLAQGGTLCPAPECFG